MHRRELHIQHVCANDTSACRSQLKEAIIEGGVPFDRVHGTRAFEYPRLDPRFNEVFNTAMYNLSTLVIQKILEAYNGFKHIKQLVDVGGSLSNTLKAITTKYSHVKGINFDLPHVIQHAPEYPEDGKVIVVESILPDLPETSTLSKRNSQIDVLMMTQNPGGKERTKHEFMTLATGAGFSGIRFECFTCNLWVMEFYK
ncbi:Flavone 3'-O-methyltransferase 1 [Citrus sinensis]|uniref:Flavone 3'-O-methyltransferase 1 n=7 Tax=Citrus sinensis TaxID=2711 RepID=A0ACB8M7L2_CITSI|nr:Flavone 3'-O-methyltransferase 1 [Citrus sinensis]KAH9781425.1 Flavone 3'-O-methyltransferase 1 [Citrus sinensis]KAH9781428.1 Flavone 3'-O-methyltransferase 1 [Citrus sinensis]KAH9781431.1 Flavone 3'-O-methyltransferase 1 [Citrus sinensis]KAH9781434.1 Flavone 3'-O-methyltransferase 1 [Citrus sinensis]